MLENQIIGLLAFIVIGAILGLILALEKRDVQKNMELRLNEITNAESRNRQYKTADRLATTEDKRPTSPYNQRSAHKAEYTWLDISVVAIAVLAFFAASWQGWVARDAEQHGLRAYLGVSSPILQCPDCANRLYRDPESGSGLHISPDLIVLTVKAGGQTPAYDVHLRHIDWEPFRINIPYQFGIPFIVHSDFARTFQSRITILPGDTQPFQAGIQVAPFRAAKFESASLRVYGGFDYLDIFDRQWTKDFCFIYRGSYTQDTFTACPEHNGDHQSEPTTATASSKHA